MKTDYSPGMDIGDKACVQEINASDAGDGSMYIFIKFYDDSQLMVNPMLNCDTSYKVVGGKVIHEQTTDL